MINKVSRYNMCRSSPVHKLNVLNLLLYPPSNPSVTVHVSSSSLDVAPTHQNHIKVLKPSHCLQCLAHRAGLTFRLVQSQSSIQFLFCRQRSPGFSSVWPPKTQRSRVCRISSCPEELRTATAWKEVGLAVSAGIRHVADPALLVLAGISGNIFPCSCFLLLHPV